MRVLAKVVFFAEFAGLGALVNGTDLVVLIGDERQLPPASALPPSSSPRSLFSALKGQDESLFLDVCSWFCSLVCQGEAQKRIMICVLV